MPRLPYLGCYEQRHSYKEKTLNKGANKQTIQQYAMVFVEGTDSLLMPQRPGHSLLIHPSSCGGVFCILFGGFFSPLELAIYFLGSQQRACIMENKMIGQRERGINGKEAGARNPARCRNYLKT